jgi:hypothetical protein
MKNNIYIAIAVLLVFLLWLYFSSESKPEQNKLASVKNNKVEDAVKNNKLAETLEKLPDAPVQINVKPKATAIASPFGKASQVDKPTDIEPVAPPVEKTVIKNQPNVLLKPAKTLTELPSVMEKSHPPYDTSRPPPIPLKTPDQYPPEDGSPPPNAY